MNKFLLSLVLGLVVMTSVIASNVNASDSAKVNSSAVKVDEKLTGVKPSAEFKKLIQKAGKGDAKAQYNLGVMYDQGQGVEQDHKKAFGWYKKAAEQGVAKAQYNLGVMYDQGQGVPKNYNEAAKILG